MQADQKPLNSGFGKQSTAEEVLGGRSLAGKTVIITGGYAGLGLETTRVLAGAGATVIAPSRTPEKSRAALSQIKGKVEEGELDLLDPASIDRFAETFLASGRALNLLINNAGIMAAPLMRDARGYEAQFATNHLGHFQLTARLWPALVKAGGARVINLSSLGHRRSDVSLDDPNFERGDYDKWVSYGRSKSANVLFSVALDERGKKSGVRAFAVHPGGIRTDLARHMSKEELEAMDDPNGPMASMRKSVPQGAATTVWAATTPLLDGKGGLYCEDCDVAQAVDAKEKAFMGIRPYATNPDTAEKLWALSEKMTGVRFNT